MYKNIYKFDEMKRAEHMAVRNTVGWYLWTHQMLEVKGDDAGKFLDLIYANPISNLTVGSERYTAMLNEHAQIIDDVVIFRMEEQKFWISTLFIIHLIPWLEKHKGDYNVEFADITKDWHMYAVQGPKSMELINSLVANKVDEQRFFTIRDNTIDDIPVKINRAGFTGEKLGYEIYIAADKADFLETKLKEHGQAYGAVEVTEFQIMAWTLPTEAGFYYMRDLKQVNPFEVGQERGIGWDKNFIGKEALLKIKEEGAAREMLGFTVQDDDTHINSKHLGGPGDAVIFGDEEVGRVSKFVYSYLQEKNVGYILAKKGALKLGDSVKINGYDATVSEKSFNS